MAGKKPKNLRQAKKRQAARAARAAEAARRQRRRRRRRNIAAAVAIIAVVGLLATFLLAQGDSGTDVATTPSSTTPSAPASAAGKPCVPVADPLPPGAPAVPVKVGPPPTALVTEDLKPGTGAVVAPGSNLTVNYIGVACSTGKIFDSSYSRGKPAEFSLSSVIPGWQQGIPGMAVGGQRLLGVPPELGYGAAGRGRDIGPQETLWFVVEVVAAKPPAPS